MALFLAVAGGLVLAACGSTRTVTQTTTVVQERTTTVTTPATDTAPTTDTATTPTTAATPGSVPALTGSYSLDQTSSGATGTIPDNPHDGMWNADKQWTFSNGSCTAGQCTVDLRRVLSDSTIEDLKLHSDRPTGVYTGAIPGGDGRAICGGGAGPRIRLSMIVRVGGLQNTNGQTVASRLAGHIFADYACPGSTPSHEVSTYAGTLS